MGVSVSETALAPLLAATVVVGGCASRPTHDSTTQRTIPIPAAPSLPTTSTTGVEASLAAAVRAFWDLYLELGAEQGPFDADRTRARLATRTAGAELLQLARFFAANASTGLTVRGEINIAPRVLANTGNHAQVADCYDDRMGLYRIVDGTRVDRDDPRRHQVLMTLVRENAVWKVSAIRDEGAGCVA